VLGGIFSAAAKPVAIKFFLVDPVVWQLSRQVAAVDEFKGE
jgi:hypothetical protein